MGKIKYNRNTGQFEVQGASVNAGPPVSQNGANDLDVGVTTAEQQPVGNISEPTAQVDTPATPSPQPIRPVEARGNAVAGQPEQSGTEPSDVPQIDSQAVYDAQQQNIAAQQAAAEQEQEAYKSSIDQYNAMIRGWQQEADQLKAQQAESERRARVSTLVSGIADGVAALTNLYYTTQGSPNIQLHSGLEKYQDIYDKARMRRDALRREANIKLERGQLSLAQLRQQQAAAKAKADAGIGQAKADAELGRLQNDLRNQQMQQDRADKDRARQDALAKDQRDFEYRKQRYDEDRKLRMQQMGLQYAYRQDALNQKKEEAKVKAFTNRNGEDVSLDIDGKLYNFGYKPLSKQLVSVSEAVYRDAKQGMKDRIAEIDKSITVRKGKGKANKDVEISPEQVLALAEERAQLEDRLYNFDSEWENAKNANNREVFASTYLRYSPEAKESLKRMSKTYEKERNAAYGIEQEDEDNTPPSMRGSNKQDDDNTPPSRRK